MIELNTFMGLVAEPLALPNGAPVAVAPVLAAGNGDPSSAFTLTSDELTPATAVAPLWMCLPALFIIRRRLFHPALPLQSPPGLRCSSDLSILNLHKL